MNRLGRNKNVTGASGQNPKRNKKHVIGYWRKRESLFCSGSNPRRIVIYELCEKQSFLNNELGDFQADVFLATYSKSKKIN
jgi:hypothetical protein